MPRKSISFELDFMTKDILPKFTVKQFDDVSFNIKPKKQGLDYDTTGMTGKIFIGVNNDMFMQTKNITVSNNNVNILLDRNMLQKNGRAYAEVELTDSNGTITSSSFIFNIDEKIGEGAKIPGEYEGFVAKYERLISEFKSQVNETISNCNANVDNKLNTVDSLINVKISDFEKRFNRLTSSQQQDAEVIDARTDFKGVVFDNLKERIDYTDKLLRESTVSTVTTESDFTTVEATSNGYFEDVKLEGKTLVNLSTLKDKTLSNASNDERRLDFNTSMFKASTDYTLIMNVGNVANATRSLFIQWDFIDDSASKFNTISNVSSLANSTVVFKFRQDILPSKLKRVYLSLHIDDSTSCTCEIKDCIVLEGDHTQNPPSYFEGLKSVGQDVDEIVVSSVKGDGNLFDKDNVNKLSNMWLGCKVDVGNGTGVIEEDNYESLYWIRIEPSTTYTIQKMPSYRGRCGFSKNKPALGVQVRAVTSDVGTFPMKVTSMSDENYLLISGYCDNNYDNNITEEELLSSIQINKGATLKPYTPHQSDKKRLLFYNEETQTWEKPILREWDSIEKHSDGKYYYHQRSGEVVLNGSENWSIVHLELDNTHRLGTNKLINCMKPNCTVICDKFTQQTDNQQYNNDIEGISTNADSNLYIRISKSKLSTQDVEGFKQWLQTNNVTVVYQLAQEKVYECTNIDLITYANETNYIVESGAIAPKSVLKVHNNISNVVSLLQKKVSLLESNITNYMITQNRMQLASTYSADSVTFKVDYALCSEETEEYNEDLYNLILNNILVGKDNYDYDKMLTMILDYASWNQISWEQFDILVGLMDIQHNPPVEELPTDDETVEEIPNEIM